MSLYKSQLERVRGRLHEVGLLTRNQCLSQRPASRHRRAKELRSVVVSMCVSYQGLWCKKALEFLPGLFTLVRSVVLELSHAL